MWHLLQANQLFRNGTVALLLHFGRMPRLGPQIVVAVCDCKLLLCVLVLVDSCCAFVLQTTCNTTLTFSSLVIVVSSVFRWFTCASDMPDTECMCVCVCVCVKFQTN